MAFQGAQNTDARYSIFSEVHSGGNQTITVTNNINSDDYHRHAKVARFDSHDRQPCLEGTRKDILNSVDSWIEAQDPKVPRIFWINGLAGTGKTTIAYTIAKKCKDVGIPSASFFCSRDDADASNPNLLFTTIADQLGHFYAPFQQQVSRAHISDPGLRYSSISNQLEELLVRPVRMLQHTFPPCVIILDALDECKDDNATSVILSSLSRHIETLAPLKFLVTSRPEHRIFGGFRLLGLRLATRRLNLHEVELNVVEQDIEHYLTTCFNDMKERWELDAAWPATKDVRSLTRFSHGLFIFASTAVKFIQDPNYSDPMGQLARLLSTTVIEGSSPHTYLDTLYMHVLTGAFPNISVDLSQRLKNVLGTIALLQYPLYPVDIEHLLKLGPGTIRNTAMHLGSVLVVPKDDHEMIRLIHPSFFDFLTDTARCPDPRFVVDSEVQHALLANTCLDSMRGLKRDICQIGDPSKLNSEVVDLPALITKYITSDLQYACRNWTHHLSRTRVADVPLELLRKFCFGHLLQWVEVCSLLGELRSALVGLSDACWLVSKLGSAAYDVLELLQDCKRFIRDFFPALCASSSHTYYSALLFTPSETALREKYSHELKHSLKVHFAVDKKWDACLRTMEGHSSRILSVAISPGGGHIATGSQDGTVRVWDFMTGAHLQCFVFKSKWILSVAFSPCGFRIVSGLNDNTVQLLDVASGACLAECTGHAGHVNAVIFSPDGTHISSGSRDRTIRIWDATGVPLRTLEGHSREVMSVAYSPDSRQIISGGADHTIRIWEASGSHLKTLHGHSNRVNAVAYSPNGALIVSGSDDNTIRIWGASGACMRTLAGHTSMVTSVAFSPDGTRIVSGSGDATIRIWETTGAHLRALGGRCGVVTSVAYSPDATQIVSGTSDGAARIWDAITSTQPGTVQVYFGWVSGLMPALPRSSTHLSDRLSTGISNNYVAVALSPSRIATHDVNSTTIDLWDTSGNHLSELKGAITHMLFSPSGTYLAMVSDDFSVRLYSGLSGMVLRSIEGDWRWVYSPTFSPDGDYLAFGSADTTIRIWNVNDAHCPVRVLRGHSDNVDQVIFSPCGSYIVSSSDDMTIRLWSTATWTQLVHFLHTGPLHNIYISEDQKSIVGTMLEEPLENFPVPQDLWHPASDTSVSPRFDRSVLSTDGWLYAENPRRRVCWLPARSRPDRGTYSDNGCFLGLFSKGTEILHISQP